MGHAFVFCVGIKGVFDAMVCVYQSAPKPAIDLWVHYLLEWSFFFSHLVFSEAYCVPSVILWLFLFFIFFGDLCWDILF